MNDQLTHEQLQNIFKTYEQYGAKNLAAFLQAIWKEAYDLGVSDTESEVPLTTDDQNVVDQRIGYR